MKFLPNLIVSLVLIQKKQTVVGEKSKFKTLISTSWGDISKSKVV